MSDDALRGARRRSKIIEGATRARETRPNPRRLRLQYEAYNLVVEEGWKQEDVRIKLGLRTCQTVGRMVCDEDAARAIEFAKVRATTIARSCAIYDNIIRVHEARMMGPNARGDEARYILRAQFQKERVLGVIVDRTEVEIREAPYTGAVNSDHVTRLLRMAIAAKPADANPTMRDFE